MIDKISTILAQLPPNWMSRVTARSGQVGSPEAEMRKLLGEPLPQALKLRDLPRDLQALFGARGMLQRIKRKLEWISRRRGGKIIPARNTIACVDEQDNIYMGVDFIKKYSDNEDVIAGIMAHEWGHMLSELAPGTDLSHLNWDQMHELRRDEEGAADAFSGRAVYQLGYDIEKVVKFIESLDKVDKKVQTQKYHDTGTRVAILREACKAQKKVVEQIRKLFGDKAADDPERSRLIAVV